MQATFNAYSGTAVKEGIEDKIAVVRPILETPQAGARVNVVLDWYC